MWSTRDITSWQDDNESDNSKSESISETLFTNDEECLESLNQKREEARRCIISKKSRAFQKEERTINKK